MRKLLIVIMLALISQLSWAGILTLTPSGKKLEGVALSQSAALKTVTGAVSLSSLGHGVRVKKMAFFPFDVYVAELFTSNPALVKRGEGETLASLPTQKYTAIRLHMLRDLPSLKIQESFKEALVANKVNLESEPIQHFLKTLVKVGDVKKNQSIVLVANWSDASLNYEDSNGALHTIGGGTAFLQSVFSIWLGTPADAELSKLKKALLGA